MAEYNKMMKFIERTTDQIKASIYELAKSKANLPMELEHEAKALLAKMPMESSLEYSNGGHYKSCLLKMEQKIQNHHPSKIARAQSTGQPPPQKKQRTTNTTTSNVSRNSNGNYSGRTSITMPDLGNLSDKELKEKFNDYFTNVLLLACQRPCQKCTHGRSQGKGKSRCQTSRPSHHPLPGRNLFQNFCWYQNGKTKTMEVSKAFRERFPCKYLSHPESFGGSPIHILGNLS
jgi:hypothetical protein